MTRLAAAVLALVLGTGPVLAADAAHPDRNVDKSNDHGGDTGNSKVDTLNKGQLDEKQKPAPATAPAPSQPKSTD